MSAKHAPGPLFRDDEAPPNPCGRVAIVGDISIASTGLVGRGASSEENEANAREIVRRWNTYPDLLAACDSLVRVVEQLIPEESARGVANVVLFQARSALSRAKGGAS